jgi:DMSO/TMAO reductase YedYZ molybdopterin-dependent catalytic subunit
MGPSLGHLGGFLAVRMNGEALPLDHGSPIRLAVPGWYGCAWIKWVRELRVVSSSEPATSQMKEFATRTHQTAVHELARDYAPPAIETAATPVRVEKRRGDTGLEYRIVGIVWGGPRPVSRLAIRFSEGDAWKTFDLCPSPKTSATWALWTYSWKPAGPGRYSIALRVPDAAVPQRRLDMGWYVRDVVIDEV